MTITVYPYKLTQRELEARLEPGLVVLPGQLMRFESAQPIYGQVKEVRAMPPASAGMPEGYGVIITLLYGCPALEPQRASLLDSSQMAREVERLQEPFEHPLRLSRVLTGELARLGTLTLVDGHDFVLKYETLLMLVEAIQPYKKLLMVDPLGVFEEGDGFGYFRAGHHVQLSVKAVGSKRFLNGFGELFAPDLREQALRVIADHLPQFSKFIGFHELLNLDAAVNVPLKNLIVQNYHAVMQTHVFADGPEQALDMATLLSQSVSVLDLSGIDEPWKRLFYEQVCLEALDAADSYALVLLYPENYLPDLTPWIQKAEEAGLNLVVLTSPYASKSVRKLASNRIYADSRQHVELQGDLTLGLPVRFALTQTELQAPDRTVMPQTVVAESVQPPVGTAGELPVSLAFEPVHLTSDLTQDEPDQLLAPPPTSRNPAEQAWWFEVSQPVTEDEIMPSEEAFPLATDSEPEPEAAVPAIVDLSAPEPEPTLSFLTAEQLSALLGSSGEETAGGTPSVARWEDVVEEAPQEQPDLLDYPDAEEGAWSEPESGPEFKVGETDSSELWDLAPPATELPEVAHTVRMETPEAAKLEAESSPLIAVPPEEAVASDSAPPPFPTPEEYRKEEFDFELNLDEMAPDGEADGGYYSSYLADGEVLPNAVAQSLSEFEGQAPLADEPLFDFEPELYPSGSATVAPPVGISEPPAPVQESASSAGSERLSGMDDPEMQEALDLIFPQEFIDTHPQAGQTSEALAEAFEPEPAPAALPVSVEEEMVPIVPKVMEPSVEDQMGFQVGDRVRHPAYGIGVVQRIIPMEESVVLNITFDTVGKRLLDPALCELQREMP